MKTYISTPPDNVKVYRALLTQAGPSAPVPTVLENTLGGDVTWGYTDTGKYTATSASLFTAGKVCLPPVNASVSLDGTTTFVQTAFYRTDESELQLQTALIDPGEGTITLTDEALMGSYVKITVDP